MEQVSNSSPAHIPDEPDQWPEMIAAVQRYFATHLAEMQRAGNRALFTVEGEGLYDRFLSQLPSGLGQRHTCRACRRFVETFGAIVMVDDGGQHDSLFFARWSPLDLSFPPQYAGAAWSVAHEVSKRPVQGVFVSSEQVWGQPQTGPWYHFAVTPSAELVHRDPLRTAGQVAAAKRHDFEVLMRGLAEYSPELVEKALGILRADALYRGEKVLGAAEWLHNLQMALRKAPSPLTDFPTKHQREALVWRAVATAPAGYFHPRSTMIGTLLDDLRDGRSIADVQERFAAKMHPLQYLRPQAAPTVGNVQRAEQIVDKLGLRPALARRFAKLVDVRPVWTKPPKSATHVPVSGVFGHLLCKLQAPVTDLGASRYTWTKFARTVLPEATSIDFLVPTEKRFYVAQVTAVDPLAPSLLQWDCENDRYPVTWYGYNGGSHPHQWRLAPGKWHEVVAIVPLPPHAVGKVYSHQRQAVHLALQDCRDQLYKQGALFFPEQLRAELHEVRRTLEAYAKSGVISGLQEAEVCGPLIEDKGPDITLRVLQRDGTRIDCIIDRWE